MYQIILVLAIFWEIALTLWPWLLALALVWVVALVLAARQPRALWRQAIRPTALLALAIGVVVFLISPMINRSTFADVAYWVDWANLIGFAGGCVAAAFVWLWPMIVWVSSKAKKRPALTSI